MSDKIKYLKGGNKLTHDVFVPVYLTRPVLTLVSKTDTTITVSSSNPDDLSLIQFYINNELVYLGSDFQRTFTGLTEDTLYNIQARTSDGAGNWSQWGSLTVRTDEAASSGGVNNWIPVNSWSSAA